MRTLLESNLKNPGFSPVLLMLLAEKLERRGCGSSDYDYIDYYHDQYGNIYGCIDEVVVTPDSTSWGDDNWEDDYMNMGQDFDEYPDYSEGGGGNGQSSDQMDINRGKNFATDLGEGKVNLEMTTKVCDFLSLTESVTSLVPTVANMVKQDIGILGKIGSVLGGLNIAYSGISAVIGFADEEISPRDWVNTAGFLCSVGSLFIPGLGLISVAIAVTSLAVPGDQGNGQNVYASGGQY